MMNAAPSISVAALLDALSDSSIKALRTFAEMVGVDYQQQWSGLDLVVHARRWVTYQQQPATLAAIDGAVAGAWSQLAAGLVNARKSNGQHDAIILSAPWIRPLGMLTERFPSDTVHDALVLAMLAVGRKLGELESQPQPPWGNLRRELAPEGTVFAPAWLRTINRTPADRMREIFRDCPMFFLPGDYFAGYVVAWRFGADVAARYALALHQSLPKAYFNPFPLGSDRQILELERCVEAAFSRPSDGEADFPVQIAELFIGLRGPLSEWSWRLAEVFLDRPALLGATHEAGVAPLDSASPYDVSHDENSDLDPFDADNASAALASTDASAQTVNLLA